MIRHAIFLLILVIMVPSLAFAQNVKKGDTAVVPDWEWVDVMNPDPIIQNFSNRTHRLKYGETCGIEIGGTVTVVGISNDSKVLVRYTAPDDPTGTPCPTGVLFFTTEKKFSKMTSEHNQICISEQRERDLVKKLLNK